MPRLILLRHATAERARPGESDLDRALTKGGRKESEAIGHVIAKRGETIDLMLASDSRRTRETWDEVAEELRDKPATRLLRSLYEAENYLPILKTEGGEARVVLVIGHNPAMHETAITLAANLAGRDGSKLKAGFPKAAVAIFDFDGEWVSLRPHQMRLVAFLEADK